MTTWVTEASAVPRAIMLAGRWRVPRGQTEYRRLDTTMSEEHLQEVLCEAGAILRAAVVLRRTSLPP